MLTISSLSRPTENPHSFPTIFTTLTAVNEELNAKSSFFTSRTWQSVARRTVSRHWSRTQSETVCSNIFYYVTSFLVRGEIKPVLAIVSSSSALAYSFIKTHFFLLHPAVYGSLHRLEHHALMQVNVNDTYAEYLKPPLYRTCVPWSEWAYVRSGLACSLCYIAPHARRSVPSGWNLPFWGMWSKEIASPLCLFGYFCLTLASLQK